MDVEKIVVDRVKARELYQQYKKHQHYSEPIDLEIQRAYQRLAQGRTVIRAVESVRLAGLNEQGLPKLALCRATETECYWHTTGGEGRFDNQQWSRARSNSRANVRVPWPGLTGQHKEGRAQVPLVPIHLRPKRGLANYHILFEAEWTRIPPHDPYLLRRIGGDLWLVVAAWDLTPVERAAMATRMSA